jgi:chromate transporter
VSVNPTDLTPLPSDTYEVKPISLLDLLRTFFVFGVIGFGGPAAHLALMERELVNKRQWLSRQHFLDLLAAINLVPGPNSTEMALHIGLLAGGFRGMLAAGAGFILPAVFFSVILAMIYVSAGSVPAVRGLLLGVEPIILALILSAGYRLAKKALDNMPMRVLCVAALVAVFFSTASLMRLVGGVALFSVHELTLLLATGALYLILRRARVAQSAVMLILPLLPSLEVAGQVAAKVVPTMFDIFVRFFIIGGTLFGSGYVLASYLQRSFVDETGWLTPQQLVDVFAIGQSTPGPVLSTSSAAGYVMLAPTNGIAAGVAGAVLATVGVFLPAFIVVLLLGRLVPYLRRYPIVLEFLKGVNAGVIALLVGTFANLALTTLVRDDGGIDWIALAMTVGAFLGLERFNLGPVLLTVIGAALGLSRIAFGV